MLCVWDEVWLNSRKTRWLSHEDLCRADPGAESPEENSFLISVPVLPLAGNVVLSRAL